MATMPETVAESIEGMEPSPAVMVWRAWCERSWTRSGLSWTLFLVSEKISARKARGGEEREQGDDEGVSWRRGLLAWEMAAAKAWFPGAMGSTPMRGHREGERRWGYPVSKVGGVFE